MEASCSRFTSAEGGARLAAAAGEKNILAVEYSSFIATRLVHEEAYKIRGSLADGRQRSVYVTRASRVPCVAYELRIMTDLRVASAIAHSDLCDWRAELDTHEVLVCTSSVLRQLLEEGVLAMVNINVLILDSCHMVWRDENLQYIMKLYKQTEESNRPRILAITFPLFSSKKDTEYNLTAEKIIAKSIEDKIKKKEESALETGDEEKIDDKEKSASETGEELINGKEESAPETGEEEKIDEKEEKKIQVEKEVGVYKNLDDYDMYEKLEWKIEELEKELCCQMDLAEDIDGGKRLSGNLIKPKELIIEYNAGPSPNVMSKTYQNLDSYMRDTVQDALDFINEHRYDPTEIYGEDLYDEFKNIPDPSIEPKYIFKQFIYVLDQLGPYAADKAALSLLSKLEKLKIKVPYERHFLLLCLCTSVFVKIRCYADAVFANYSNDWQRIKLYCTPKVLRIAEILQRFQPPETIKKPGKNSQKLINDIEQCDFASLGDKIEDKVNTIESNLKEYEDYGNGVDSEKCDSAGTMDSEGNKDDSGLIKCDSEINKQDSAAIECVSEINGTPDRTTKGDSEINTPNSPGISTCDAVVKSDSGNKVGFSRRVGGRLRGRGRTTRNNPARAQQMLQNPDALCGIVFMREALMAKILFMLIVDMSRAHPALSYLSAQYCAVETPADPGTDPRECQRQGKQQEEVLKKFRMHECNLLLATSALEEGIDLPRCNLVLRWDVPASYRSYGLCRGRARAARSTCAVLTCADPVSTSVLLQNLAMYRRLDQIISKKCGCGIQDEPPESEEIEADSFTFAVKPYTPYGLINGKTTKNDAITIEKSPINGIDSDSEKTKRMCNEKDASHDIQINNEINNALLDLNNLKITDIDSQGEAKCIVNYDSNSADSATANDNNTTDSNIKSDNLVCNRCNNVKNSVSVVCSCLNIANVSDSINTNNSKETDSKKVENEMASVDLSTAIALINRYCGKLPSDTFTRLAPQWWMEEVQLPVRGSSETRAAYVCTLRLPLNCPVKYNIVGHPMPTRVLARRIVALQACRILHKSGELDNQLMPIGKENFKAADLETNAVGCLDSSDPNDSARPGTTKRRQYYFKRTAWAFTDCQPVVDSTDEQIEPPIGTPTLSNGAATATEPEKTAATGAKRNMLYAIVSKLCCALPERYNTRGRRLHAPQAASQAVGVLMARDRADDLQIPSFPVYTRSGEVRVSVEHVPDADVRMSPRRGRLVRRFMRFVFSEVLRVRRRGMKLHPDASAANNYYIVPTVKLTREDGSTKIDIDWPFLELIYQHTEEKKLSEPERPVKWGQEDDDDEEQIEKVEEEKEKDGKVKKLDNPLLKAGELFVFDSEKYKEAVVTPWYRNQDQPQFFLVAEICWNLTPDSAFPSATHTSFRNYYHNKYGVELTQSDQPLLDVDHTSARLNLLTPRYVNRKGVALPVSSERTRRAKRDRLDQKQILVPELCRRHPFQAPLWFATVALPCVLYRINALLIADEIRRAVAIDVGLGIPKIDETTCPGFRWPPLDFGWSLAEVLSAESDKSEKKEEENSVKEEIEDVKEGTALEKPVEKTVNDILAEKFKAENEQNENEFEIGTWSNDMASSIPEDGEYDEYLEPLPSNLTFCTTASGGANWCDPIEKPPKSQFHPSRAFSMAESDCSYMSSDFDTDDSDLNSESEYDGESGGLWSKESMGVRIEYKTAHEAEAVDVERKKKVNPAPEPDEEDEELDRAVHYQCIREGQAPQEYIDKFRASVAQHNKEILEDNNLIKKDAPILNVLPESKEQKPAQLTKPTHQVRQDLFPYFDEELSVANDQITIESIEKNKRVLLQRLKSSLPEAEIKKLNCFSMVDVDIDSSDYVNEKVANVGFDTIDSYLEKVGNGVKEGMRTPYYLEGGGRGKDFDFDYQPTLDGHPGPSPSVILQALTMSNANDGINLERLETIGDSFLKFAITAYLYCAHPAVHEGKLSHMRSKQVSNLNLYRLGRGRRLGARMIASKFEPHDNWLPPCHRPPHSHPRVENRSMPQGQEGEHTEAAMDGSGCFIPYNLITQHSIPDKSIADCVEALIGAYLLECGPRGALLFMSWLGIKVLPRHELVLREDHPFVVASSKKEQKPKPPTSPKPSYQDLTDSSDCSSDDEEDPSPPEELSGDEDWSWPGRPVGSLRPYKNRAGVWIQPIFGALRAPPSPLLRYISDPEGELEQMLSGYDQLERTLQYRFKDRSLLLQALTHASHQKNRLTDCYQRLEFLGDAILDYLITRHLYEDPRRHSPGALTDLRSALVNNTIFATLAARHGFHKYFRHMSPGLNEVLTKYVKIQEENGHSISEEHYLIQEDELEQAEDVEVPKALGDLFESVAGAVFLDSGMSLGAVWASYERLMGAELEAFSAAAPKSPVRELLEAEPDTAKFGKPERLADGRRVRVCVEVFGRGAFKGVGRNYRIAKGTAARCALRHLRSQHR